MLEFSSYYLNRIKCIILLNNNILCDIVRCTWFIKCGIPSWCNNDLLEWGRGLKKGLCWGYVLTGLTRTVSNPQSVFLSLSQIHPRSTGFIILFCLPILSIRLRYITWRKTTYSISVEQKQASYEYILFWLSPLYFFKFFSNTPIIWVSLLYSFSSSLLYSSLARDGPNWYPPS